MKLPSTLITLAVSSCAGFAAVFFGAGLVPDAHPQPAGEAAKNVAAPAPDSGGKPDSKSPGKIPAVADSRKFLAGHFRTALELEGIDSSWAESLAAADAAGFPALLERMGTAGKENQRDWLRELLLARWVMLDPLGGAEFFKSKKDEKNLSILFCQWQRLDFEAAVAGAGEYGDQYLRRTLRDKGLTDPKGLMAWLAAERPDLNPLTLFNSGAEDAVKVLMRLAEADPSRMLAWARLAPGELANKGIEVSYPEFARRFAALLAKTRPDEAIAWAKSLPESARSAEALAGAAQTLAVSDPARALEILKNLPAGGEVPWQVLGAIDVTDPARAKALAESLPKGEMRAWLMANTKVTLLGKDPAKAFALADSLGPEEGLSDGVYPPEEARTPEGARRLTDAALEAGDSTFRDTAVKEVLLAWMEKDSASLADYLKGKMDTPLLVSMKESLQGGLALQQILYGQADPALLGEIGLPPQAMVKALRNIDPARAVEILKTMDHPEPAMVSDIVLRLESGEAMALADSLKSPEAQAAVWKTLTVRGMNEDSHRTSEWIATLPAGQGRDTAVLAMTQEIQKSDPDLAWGWALSMTEPDLKAQALTTAARAWNRRDSASLQQALNDSHLTPAERGAVEEKLKSGPFQP